MTKEKKTAGQCKRRDRHDGLATKTILLECAARLMAQKGFAQVTSKEICQLAGANPAAINYHFGGRRGLYKELLLHIHQNLIDERWLKQLASMPLKTEARLERLIDRLAGQLWSDDCWYIQAWCHEMLAPSLPVEDILRELLRGKGRLLAQLLSDYTGIGAEDRRIYACMLSLAAPFFAVSLGKKNLIGYQSLLPGQLSDEELLTQMKTFALGGLRSLRKN